MDAVVYTTDPLEYNLIQGFLEKSGFTVTRGPLNGHGYYEYGYHLIVVAIEGALGLNIVSEFAHRYPASQIIWIPSDPGFAQMALSLHICHFLVRPCGEEQIIKALRLAIPRCKKGSRWSF